MANARTVLALFLCPLLAVSCATQPVAGAGPAPGLWLGQVHGFIALLSLMGSLR